MSGFPIVLDGGALRVTVVGGGRVASRRVLALLESGATVRVVALDASLEIRTLAVEGRVVLMEGAYAPGLLGESHLVIAATNDAATNASVAAEARRLGVWVNVVDAPETGTCVIPAVHRAGDLVISVTAGGVPDAAKRIRDAIARRFDGRYARAIDLLRDTRDVLLTRGDRARWRASASDLIGPGFCEAVEGGTLESRVVRWR
ncbi:MAG TPA: NAD(P)-dependent oxidoreductase [Gemmatimonadaceae bacterium]|nr:NAD(P)-dependent oxidoreductase [Gemmatimonadaceae bacterium]